MVHIHFIVNPIAGKSKHQIDISFLRKHFVEDEYKIQLKYSEYKKHAIALTNSSIAEGAQVIVACGGDGTINEVARCLVDTVIPLGIIAIGSGNGLASNLNIPKQIEKAIEVIKNQNIIKIDVGNINDHYFFSNTGFGFDANVIKNYEASERRTLACYIKASLKSFYEFHKQMEIEININNTSIVVNPFLIFISNSNELGYNVSLTPKASLQDGLLDVVIVKRINKVKMLLFGILLLFKKQHLLKGVKCFQTKQIQLTRNKGLIFESQIDGELQNIDDKSVLICLKEQSLSVFV